MLVLLNTRTLNSLLANVIFFNIIQNFLIILFHLYSFCLNFIKTFFIQINGLKKDHHYQFHKKLSNSKDVYITIESSKRPKPTECTPLLSKPITSSRSSIISYSGSDGHCIENPSFISVKYHKVKLNQFCEFPLLAIGFLLIGGFSIATYLLILENQFPKLGLALDLVNHEVWSKIPRQSDSVMKTKVFHVLITQTGGNGCEEIENCINLLRTMQTLEKLQKNAEIPYNFLIGGDGQAYEIRGWEHESGFNILPVNTSMVIGFIGNYTDKSPTEEQLKSATSLIKESHRKQKLHENFQIYGVQNLTVSHQDGKALFYHVSKWNQFDTLLKVL